MEVESGWAAECDADCVSFWRENGVGALQISAYKHSSGTISDGELRNLLKDEIPESAVPQCITCGEFVGVEIDYVTEGIFWRKLWLTHGPLLVFITYNSDGEDNNVERQAVDEMLSSLKTN